MEIGQKVVFNGDDKAVAVPVGAVGKVTRDPEYTEKGVKVLEVMFTDFDDLSKPLYQDVLVTALDPA